MRKLLLKLVLPALIGVYFSSATAQVDKDVLNWYNSKKTGMSTDKAYKKLKKRTPDTVVVAIIDSGIDYNHPDFKDMLAYKNSECLEDNIFPNLDNDHDQNGVKGDCLGWNFNGENNDIEDLDGHGTHVAGLIADFFQYHKSSL